MATTTPNYGWDVPTSTDYVADGAVAIETLGDDIDATLWTALGGAYPGLRLVKKQTIGSGVSSVAVTSAFSATYDAYKIVIAGGVGSAAAADLGLSLTGGTSAYSYCTIYSTYATASVLVAVGNGVPTFVAGASTTDRLQVNCDLQDPFNAKFTTFSAPYSSNLIAGNTSGIHKAATSYTGFTITPTTGTITGGTIYVYGYGAS